LSFFLSDFILAVILTLVNRNVAQDSILVLAEYATDLPT
jgi:hypothetical protein